MKMMYKYTIYLKSSPLIQAHGQIWSCSPTTGKSINIAEKRLLNMVLLPSYRDV